MFKHGLHDRLALKIQEQKLNLNGPSLSNAGLSEELANEIEFF
jgi:hypothetical protein